MISVGRKGRDFFRKKANVLAQKVDCLSKFDMTLAVSVADALLIARRWPAPSCVSRLAGLATARRFVASAVVLTPRAVRFCNAAIDWIVRSNRLAQVPCRKTKVLDSSATQAIQRGISRLRPRTEPVRPHDPPIGLSLPRQRCSNRPPSGSQEGLRLIDWQRRSAPARRDRATLRYA